MNSGRIMRDEEHEENKKKTENGNNSNGNGNENGDSNGSSDGGGIAEGWSAKYKKTIDCNNPKGFSQRAHCQGRKKMNEAKNGDHEVSMAQSQLKNSAENIAKLRKKLGKRERDIPAWMQAKITDTEHNTDAAASYVDKISEARDGKSAKDKDYSLRDWFAGGGWVQAGGKYDGKPCAKQPGQKTKPFCRDADDRAAMSKDDREKRAKKKRKEDPNPNRKGKAKIVRETHSNWRVELEQLFEGDTPRGKKPKVGDTITADMTRPPKKPRWGIDNTRLQGPENPLEEGKKDACYRKVKSRYSVWPSAYASGALVKCRKVGAANWGNTSENYQDYDLRDEYIEENIIRAAKMATKVIKALGKSKVRKSLPPRNLRNLSPERKEEIMYQAQKRIKSYKPGEIDKSASRKYAADRLHDVYSRRQNVIKQGGSPKEAAAQSISSMGPGDALGKDFNIKRGGRGRRGAHGPQTDRGKGNKAARRSGQEVVDTGNIDVHYRPTRDQSIQRSRERRSMRSMERRLNRIQSDDRKAMSSMETRLNNLLNLNNSYEFSNWRDDFKLTEYEFIDLIKPDPMKGLSEEKLDKCEKNKIEKYIKGMKKNKGSFNDNYGSDSKSVMYATATNMAKKACKEEFSDWRTQLGEDWQKVNKRDKTDGMSQKAVDAYKRENPGSKLKTAVTEKNPGGKRAKRRKSFCARSNGQRKMHNIDCSKTPDKAICKARKRWRC